MRRPVVIEESVVAEKFRILPPFDPDKCQDGDAESGNGMRAGLVEGFLKRDDDVDSEISDIVTDLLHLAHKMGHNPYLVLWRAESYFDYESGYREAFEESFKGSQSPAPCPTEN